MSTHTKARLRHVEAALAAGNCALAQTHLRKLAVGLNDQPATLRAMQLAQHFPIQWCAGGLLRAPDKRSSSGVDHARVERTATALDKRSLFAAAVVYDGAMWIFGG